MALNHRVITICARNFISRTAVLAESYAAHHPGEKVTILLVDTESGVPEDLPKSDYFTIATTADLAIDPDEIRRMAMIYEITEFCTSLKPWVLQMLLDQGADVATYLDPDIEVFSSLDQLADAAFSNSIALTPHTLEPFPRDGRQPTESDIMLAGAFNLGYISVSRDAHRMLAWWKERLQRYSVIAPEGGVFVDQRWIDMVPSYFPHTIIRDPGYNVAYWNLHERQLIENGSQVLVNGAPLRFFHFSGYRTDRPWILNKYYSHRPRVLMSENPVVYALCERYRAQLYEAERHFGSVDELYGFGRLRNGTEITHWLRRLYRHALLTAEEEGGELPPVPFSGDDSQLVSWFQAPSVKGGLLNNYVSNLWHMRADLQSAFPDPHGRDEQALSEWSLRPESGLIPELLDPSVGSRRSTPKTPISLADGPGVNVSGYFKAELGVGEAGRQLLEAVRSSGLPFRTDLSMATSNRQEVEVELQSSEVVYPISVAAINADVLDKWAGTIGAQLVNNTYLIGQWAWELEEFVDPAGSLELVDEVWAISEFARDAIAKKTTKPVHAIPLSVRRPISGMTLERRELGLPEVPYFLFTFDFASVFDRKNPTAVIEAFKLAFKESAGYHLVIKSINGSEVPSDRERLRLASEGRSDIHFLESYLSPEQVGALMKEAVAYVSLHRSEGLGFTMAEAMSYAKPVIATAYSANMEFMNAQNSLLVPYKLVDVGPECQPYPPHAQWADPDIEAAARHMAWLAEKPEEARSLGQRAQQSILAERTVDRAAEFVRSRVSSIMGSGAVGRKRSLKAMSLSGGNELTPTQRAMHLVHTPPDVNAPSRHPRLAKRYRQILYRAMSYHDLRLNEQLTAVLEALAEVESKATHIDLVTTRLDRIESLLSSTGDDTRQRFSELDQRLIELNSLVQRIDQEMVARPYTAVEQAGTFVDDDGARIMGYLPSQASVHSYADFESTYRGTEDVVSGMLKPYVPVLAGHDPVFEVGSGRGELLELLRAEGIEAFGVDMDESMYARCIEKGLDVRLGNGLELLRRQAEGTLGAVVSVEVVEHLEVSTLREFFELASKAIRPDGLFVAETVNPHSPPALKAFWLDITHVRPLYPESLLALAQQTGFESARIMFPGGSGDLDADLRICGSYALVANKGH